MVTRLSIPKSPSLFQESSIRIVRTFSFRDLLGVLSFLENAIAQRWDIEIDLREEGRFFGDIN